MQDYYPLTKENIMDLIGKKVELAYEGNPKYRGIAIIKEYTNFSYSDSYREIFVREL